VLAWRAVAPAPGLPGCGVRVQDVLLSAGLSLVKSGKLGIVVLFMRSHGPGPLAALLRLPVLSLPLLMAAGCSRPETAAEAGVRTQTLLLGNVAEPADLDPDAVNAWTDSNIDYALFEGLTLIDEDTTQAVPAAAAGWDVSPDGLVYTFHLRPEGRWSNGDPVTADDFVYSFRRILTPSYGAAYSYMLWPIRNARAYNEGKIGDFSHVGALAVDAATLRITLERPTPYLPGLASHTTWLPVHRATIETFGRFDQKGTRWTRAGNLVGNGPFTLKEWVPNSRITVVKNPRYWDAAHVRLNRIEFFPIENSESEEASFRSGQLQVTYGLPITRIATYRREHPELLRIDSRLATYYVFINVRKPPLDNPKLRRALALDIDRTKIARDVLEGSRSPAHAFTPPDCAGYTCEAQVPDDIAEARRLLAEAGYPGGRGLPAFEALSYMSDTSVRTLEVIQSQWARDLGVHITITPQEQKTLFQNQQDGNYSIAFSAWIGDYGDPSTFLEMMVTGGGNNWAGWSNAGYDQLIHGAANTADQGARFALFQKAEAILLEQAPLIPVFFGEQPYLIRPYVHGWPPSKLGFVRFKNVWLEK
jgi:oligopeptide transport system substrate-binding protein